MISPSGQIKKAIGYTASAGSASTTPVKPRGKKEVGTGMNKTPSKIKKTTTPRKVKTKAEDSEDFGGVEKHEALDSGRLTHTTPRYSLFHGRYWPHM